MLCQLQIQPSPGSKAHSLLQHLSSSPCKLTEIRHLPTISTFQNSLCHLLVKVSSRRAGIIWRVITYNAAVPKQRYSPKYKDFTWNSHPNNDIAMDTSLAGAAVLKIWNVVTTNTTTEGSHLATRRHAAQIVRGLVSVYNPNYEKFTWNSHTNNDSAMETILAGAAVIEIYLCLPKTQQCDCDTGRAPLRATSLHSMPRTQSQSIAHTGTTNMVRPY